jgi:uncharacterized membrane protein HdeD (DUF308 family)
MSSVPSSEPPAAGSLTARLSGGIWAVAVGTGLLSVLIGLAVVAWPKATIGVVAVLFGLKLIFHGVYRVAQAIVAGDAGGGTRTLYAIIGVLSFIIGVLALRHLFQTVTVIALLFGLFWLSSGIIEFITVMVGPAQSGRGAAIVLSLLSALAGIVVLAYPEISLVALTWLLGLWLITWGLVTIGVSLWIRHAEAERPTRRTG